MLWQLQWWWQGWGKKKKLSLVTVALKSLSFSLLNFVAALTEATCAGKKEEALSLSLILYCCDWKLKLSLVILLLSLYYCDSSNGGSKGGTSSQPLVQWSEVPGHTGLLYCMAQSANNPIVLMVKPDAITMQEIKVIPAKAKVSPKLMFIGGRWWVGARRFVEHWHSLWRATLATVYVWRGCPIWLWH